MAYKVVSEIIWRPYTPPPPRAPCAHLGDAISTEVCDSCQGLVRIKTFACAIHGRCTLGKKLEGIACCGNGTCEDYQPSPASCHPEPPSRTM